MSERICPVHNEELFEHVYNNWIGYCGRCRIWYNFESRLE